MPRGNYQEGVPKILGAILMMGALVFLSYLFEGRRACVLAADDWVISNAKSMECDKPAEKDKLVFLSCDTPPSDFKVFTPLNFTSNANDGYWDEGASWKSVGAKLALERYYCRETYSSGRRRVGGSYSFELKWGDPTNLGTDGWQEVKLTPYRACNDSNWVKKAKGDCGEQACQDLGPTDPWSGKQFLEDVNVGPYLLNFSDFDQKVAFKPVEGKAGTWSYPLDASCKDKPKLGCMRMSFQETNFTSLSVIARAGSDGKLGKQTVPGEFMCKSTASSTFVENGPKDLADTLRSGGQQPRTLIEEFGAWVLGPASMISLLLAFKAWSPFKAGGCAADMVDGMVMGAPAALGSYAVGLGLLLSYAVISAMQAMANPFRFVNTLVSFFVTTVICRRAKTVGQRMREEGVQTEGGGDPQQQLTSGAEMS